MKKVIDGEADLTVSMYALTQLRLKYMDSTNSHFEFPFLLIVPPGAKLTPFEKLARPFQIEVWLSLGLTYFFGFLFIFVVTNTGNKSLMMTIFGERANPPMLNMLDISFGGSMRKIPSKTGPRLMLASFLMFCLVVRSVYQGLLFDLIQSDYRARPVMTVDEMIEKDFHFYMYSIFQELTQHLKINSRYELFLRYIIFEKSNLKFLNNLMILTTNKLSGKESMITHKTIFF